MSLSLLSVYCMTAQHVVHNNFPNEDNKVCYTILYTIQYTNHGFSSVWSVIIPDLSETLWRVQELTGPYTALFMQYNWGHK